MKDKHATIKVTVDKSHLFTLGERMYRESIEFVRELVNNAYDADATDVHVMIGEDRITVEDNGSGMNERGLGQFFTIGSEEKRAHGLSPRFGRKRIGQFGIGKFSALALAERFIIESVKGGFKYAVVFDAADWKESSGWDLPIRREAVTPLDREGTTMILDKLKKKVGLAETEKYLRQSVPLRARKFSVYLNNKRITAKTVTGRTVPVKVNSLYGLIEGEIVVALNAADVDEAGVECRVKQVFIRRSFFGADKKHAQGLNRVTGYVNADFLPLISARSDFIVDSPEYHLFYQVMQGQLDRILKELKAQSETKNLQKVTRELEDIMKQLRGALLLNPDFIPQGRAAARLKKEGRKKIAAASADFSPAAPRGEGAGEAAGADKAPAERPDREKPPEKAPVKIEAKPIAIKRIKLNKLGISCGIVSLGENGPEAASQGNAVYINQDHPVYRKLYLKRERLILHLLRLVTQEVVLMKKTRITAREAFDWQSKLLKGALCGEE